MQYVTFQSNSPILQSEHMKSCTMFIFVTNQLLQVFGAMITENGQKYLEGPRGLDYCSILFKIA